MHYFRIVYNIISMSYAYPQGNRRIVCRMENCEWYILPSTHFACCGARKGFALFLMHLCLFVACGYKSIMQNKANLSWVEINAISVFKEVYEVFMLHESQKNKAKTKPIAGLWPKIRSTKRETSWKGYLKKQTQFLKGWNDAMLVIAMVYDNLDGSGQRKTKPIQSQNKANFRIPPHFEGAWSRKETWNYLKSRYYQE